MSQVADRTWRSSLGFIWATSGAAVGLGNIWMFSYLAGKNGGSAFVAIYLAAIFLIGFPVMLGELLIGQQGRSDPVTSLDSLSAKQPSRSPLKWRALGYLGAITLVCVLGFYSVVAGWSLSYLVFTLTGQLTAATETTVNGLWNTLSASVPWQLIGTSAFVLLCFAILYRGVNKGIESASYVMMPLLLIILIGLVVAANWYGDSASAMAFLFTFDASQISGSVILAALGQALFTLAVGAGCILTYGAYLPESQNPVKGLGIIAIMDTAVALLSGLAIFPLVFAYELSPAAGPGLMFQTLPLAFNKLPFGGVLAALFFITLVLAALSSAVSQAEPLICLLQDRFNWSRRGATLLVGCITWALASLVALSFNVGKDWVVSPFGNVYDTLTTLVTQYLLPLGAIGFSYFAGQYVDFTKGSVFKSALVIKLFRFILRIVAPCAILMVMWDGLH